MLHPVALSHGRSSSHVEVFQKEIEESAEFIQPDDRTYRVKRKIKRRRSPRGLQPQRLIMVVASTRFLVGAKERFRAHGRGAISLNHHCTSKPCERPSDERSPCSPLNTPPTVDTSCKRMVPRCQDESDIIPRSKGLKGHVRPVLTLGSYDRNFPAGARSL